MHITQATVGKKLNYYPLLNFLPNVLSPQKKCLKKLCIIKNFPSYIIFKM